MNNYTINEEMARRANDMNSYYDYKKGSATAEYNRMIEEATKIANRQKARVDSMYHEKIDALLDTYARRLAANFNRGFEIDTRCPSILVAGGSNFPVAKKAKQNAARDRNLEDWKEIEKLLDKIKGVGTAGISSDDQNAVAKLEEKLRRLTEAQEMMKAVNAFYRKHGTLDGCPVINETMQKKLMSEMESSWHLDKSKPFQSFSLSNNSAEIRRVKARIEELKKKAETEYTGWKFNGGHVEANKEANRLQVFFDEKPEESIRDLLKSHAFRWAPSAGAWQRQLTDNAIWSAKHMAALAPIEE